MNPRCPSPLAPIARVHLEVLSAVECLRDAPLDGAHQLHAMALSSGIREALDELDEVLAGTDRGTRTFRRRHRVARLILERLARVLVALEVPRSDTWAIRELPFGLWRLRVLVCGSLGGNVTGIGRSSLRTPARTTEDVIRVLGPPEIFPDGTQTWSCPLCDVGLDSVLVRNDNNEMTCSLVHHPELAIRSAIAVLLDVADWIDEPKI